MTGDRDAVVVAGVRTPFARVGTDLAETDPADLGRIVVREVLERAEIDPAAVDEVIAGSAAVSPDSSNLARVVALGAKLPRSCPAYTVNRNGASGLQGIVEATYRIRAGDADLVVVAAVESASRTPLLFSDSAQAVWNRARRARGVVSRSGELARLRPRHFRPAAPVEPERAAEFLAGEFGIGRERQDEFALRSHQKAAEAWAEGRMEGETVPVPISPAYTRALERDNGVRGDETLDGLRRFDPLSGSGLGTVTEGNSAPPADGAVSLLLSSRQRARDLGLPVLGSVLAWGFAGCDPERPGLGPVFSTPVALRRAGKQTLGRMDRVELGEANAAQALASLDALRSRRFCEDHLSSGPLGEVDPERLNVNGGAIALGHPSGASGARMILSLFRELERHDLSLGLVTLGIAGGQGASVVVERS